MTETPDHNTTNSKETDQKEIQKQSTKPATQRKKTPQPEKQPKRKKSTDIATRLLEEKVISDDQLKIAQTEHERFKGQKNIGAILVEMGFISDGALGEILNEHSGGSAKDFDIKSAIIDPRLVKKVPKDFAIRNKLIPVSYTKSEITIAMSDVFDIVALDRVKRFFPPNFSIHPVYIQEADVLQAIDQYYDYEMSIEGIQKELESHGTKSTEDDEKGDYKSPVVRLVDAIFADAVHRGASDLHFEPEDLFLRIRYRIDGKMVQIRSIHKDYWSAIAVRIKIISGMNIAETRKAQDGRINSEILGRKIDFRVSAQPTVNGENIVLRILDQKQSILPLVKLGFSEHNSSALKKAIQKPEGVIILTGPTGSGKTTTLYSVLNQINDIDKNIMTLEDPVEYHLPLIRQSNIRADVGMDFASGIKSLLRQDPDVILVGEIRDKATAVTAVQAAMTGHQVYSSLHTNDAISSIPRLLDMGVPPFLLVGSLICVIAQRLARKLCTNCKQKRPITEQERQIIGEKYKHIDHLYTSKGCIKCENSGSKGRIVISEIMVFDDELDELVATQATRKEIFSYLMSKNFVPMAEDGIQKAIKGIISIKELMRVVDLTDRL